MRDTAGRLADLSAKDKRELLERLLERRAGIDGLRLHEGGNRCLWSAFEGRVSSLNLQGGTYLGNSQDPFGCRPGPQASEFVSRLDTCPGVRLAVPVNILDCLINRAIAVCVVPDGLCRQPSPHTLSAASSVQLPAKTDRRCSKARSGGESSS